MARIVYPDNFASEQTLFTSILQHNTESGKNSPLDAFFKQQGIDIDELQAAAGNAADMEKQRLALKRDSENNTQQRDTNMKDAWKHLQDEVQFLKGFFKGNERNLGEWGITVDGKNKIVYPPSFAARAQLIQDFIAKHQSYPKGESPLQLYISQHNIDVNADLDAVNAAMVNETDKNSFDAASKLATQQRSDFWKPAMEMVRKTGVFLANLYGENSRELGTWGFTVVEDATARSLRTSKLKPAGQKINNSIVIGSVFTNTGETELQLFKGKDKKQTPYLVKPGDTMGMIKGFSSITVVNLSTLQEGKYTISISGT